MADIQLDFVGPGARLALTAAARAEGAAAAAVADVQEMVDDEVLAAQAAHRGAVEKALEALKSANAAREAAATADKLRRKSMAQLRSESPSPGTIAYAIDAVRPGGGVGLPLWFDGSQWLTYQGTTPGEPDVYLDKVNGNDAFTGTSPGQAKRTAAAAMALMGPGKTLAIVGHGPGNIYRDRFDLTGMNGAGIVSYGNLPAFLSGADVVTGWTLSPGKTATYEQNVSAGAGAPASSVHVRAYENGVLLRRLTTDTTDATPGSYRVTGTHPNYRVQVHPFGSANPDSRTIEVTTRLTCIESGENTHRISIVGIWAEKSCHMDGSMTVRGLDNMVVNCYNLHGSKHNLLIGSGFLIGGASRYAEYNASKALVVFFRTSPAGAIVVIDDHDADWTAADLAALNNMTAFLCHAGTGSPTTFSSITVRNSRGRDCSTVFNLGSAQVVRLENCESYECKAFAAVNVPTVFDGGRAIAEIIELTNVVFTFAAGATLTIRNGFTVRMRRSNAGFFLLQTGANNVTIDIDGMIVERDVWFTYSHGIRASGVSGLSVRARNVDWHGVDMIYDLAAGAALDSDYNVLRTGQDNKIGSTTYNDIAAYRAATGQDANSLLLAA